MHPAAVPQLRRVSRDQRVEIVHDQPGLRDVRGGDLVALDHALVGRGVLLLARRGGGPDEFGAGRVALQRGQHIREALPEAFDAAVQAVVEVNDGVNILPQHQFDFVEQRGITHGLRSAQHRNVGLVLERSRHLGGVAHRDRIADQQHERQRWATGRLGAEGDGAPVLRLARRAVVVEVFGAGPWGGERAEYREREEEKLFHGKTAVAQGRSSNASASRNFASDSFSFPCAA